jgi:hypothetical protein
LEDSECIIGKKDAALASKEARIKELVAKNNEFEAQAQRKVVELQCWRSTHDSAKATAVTQSIDFQLVIGENSTQLGIEEEIEKHLCVEKCQTLADERSHEVKVLLEQFSALKQEKVEAKKQITVMKDKDMERKLAEEQQKAQNLTAENARLIYQMTTDKSISDVEKKHLWRQIADQRTETKRLEQEVFRLASKLIIAERQLNEFSRDEAKAKENLKPSTESPINQCFAVPEEQPDDANQCDAAFENKTMPDPHLLDTALKGDKHRIEMLEHQLNLYRILLKQGNEFRNVPHINIKLMETGLHKDAPTKGYVNAQYYSSLERTRGQRAMSASYGPETTSVKIEPAASVFELDHLVMVDYEDFY